MQIHVYIPNGKRLTIEVEASYTVESVQGKIHALEGISPNVQKLIYTGKELLPYRTLSDFNVLPGANLHLLYHPPEDNASDDEIRRYWKSKASTGGFDEDLDIVEPQLYFRSLENLELGIIKSSEFSRCRGRYEVTNDDISSLWTERTLPNVPAWMWTSLQGIAPSEANVSSDQADATLREVQIVLAGLWKSYLSFCRIIQGLQDLDAAGFSSGVFSLLRLSTTYAATAEIKGIDARTLYIVKESLEMLIGQLLEDLVDFTVDISRDLWAALDATVQNVLFRIGVKSKTAPGPSSAIHTLRVTAYLLDLALVVYAGSHGSDLSEHHDAGPTIEVLGESARAWSWRCSTRKLACLNTFLDLREVWVFELRDGGAPPAIEPAQPGAPLSILTTMALFADLWGPVWSIPANETDKIKQYNVSKGVIYGVKGKAAAGADEPAVIRCHWDSWFTFYRKRLGNILGVVDEILLHPNDVLLIGGVFRENDRCDYTLRDFEEDFKEQETSLGTRPETWRWDTRNATIGGAYFGSASVAGTQKRIPQTTVKQRLLDKWSNNPTRVNPGSLNMYYGLEISNCTGNARRIALKDILLMRCVQPLLDRQSPGWFHEKWGVEFCSALRALDEDAIFSFWATYKDRRAEVAGLICYVLEALDTTGFQDNRFTAGVFNENSEFATILDHKANDWCTLLRDSHIMAVFAIVNSRCLECNHTTTMCRTGKPTVLETSIAITDQPGSSPPKRTSIQPYERPHSYLSSQPYEQPGSPPPQRLSIQPFGQTLGLERATSLASFWYIEGTAGRIFASVTTMNQTLCVGFERHRKSKRASEQHHICASGMDPQRVRAIERRRNRTLARMQVEALATTARIPACQASTPGESEDVQATDNLGAPVAELNALTIEAPLTHPGEPVGANTHSVRETNPDPEASSIHVR
jgi:hypothetical protein